MWSPSIKASQLMVLCVMLASAVAAVGTVSAEMVTAGGEVVGGVVMSGTKPKHDLKKKLIKKKPPPPPPPLPASTLGPCGSDQTLTNEGGVYHECCTLGRGHSGAKKVTGIGGMDLSTEVTKAMIHKYSPKLNFEEAVKECGKTAKHCMTRREAKHMFLAEPYADAKRCVKSLLRDWTAHPLPPPPKKKKQHRKHRRRSSYSPFQYSKPKPKRPAPPPPTLHIPRAVRNAMIDIAFSMGGCDGLHSFGEMLHFVRRGEWRKAAHELGTTQWCMEHPERCQTNKKCVASGK